MASDRLNYQGEKPRAAGCHILMPLEQSLESLMTEDGVLKFVQTHDACYDSRNKWDLRGLSFFQDLTNLG